MSKCIYEKEILENGYSQSYGVENDCKLESTNLELCKQCIQVAQQKQDNFFETIKNMVNTTKDGFTEIGELLKSIVKSVDKLDSNQT